MAERPTSPQTFEAALAELESILATREGGQLPLAETLAAHRRGAERGVLKAFAPEGCDASTSGGDDGS